MSEIAAEQSLSNPNLFKTLCVAVDDDKNDLLAILWGLQTAGMSCVPLHYDAITGLQNANIQELSMARVVFLDLNLERTLDRGASDQAKNIVEVFQVLKLKGPYILIVWSDFRANVDNVLNIAFQRASGIVYPVGIAVLNKEMFMIEGEADAEASYDFQGIGHHIARIISEYPQVFAMMAWENRAMAAASTVTQTLFCLHDIASFDQLAALLQEIRADVDLPPTVRTANLVISKPLYSKKEVSKIFYKIGYAAYGKHVDDEPVVAIESGLLPLLEDQFLAEPAIDICRKIWKSVFNESEKENLTPKVICKLNSCLLIDSAKVSSSPRGIFLELRDSSREKFLLTHLEAEKETLQLHFFDDNALAKLARKEGEDEKKKVIDSCRVGILECSAACDHAQNKIGVSLGLVGALIPVEYEKYISKLGNIYDETIKLYFENKEYLFKVSFKYPFGLTPAIMNDPAIVTPLFRIREQLLGAIAARFAAHASRPGIISVH